MVVEYSGDQSAACPFRVCVVVCFAGDNDVLRFIGWLFLPSCWPKVWNLNFDAPAAPQTEALGTVRTGHPSVLLDVIEDP